MCPVCLIWCKILKVLNHVSQKTQACRPNAKHQKSWETKTDEIVYNKSTTASTSFSIKFSKS